jgi:coiled-coil domain-containing protein 55
MSFTFNLNGARKSSGVAKPKRPADRKPASVFGQNDADEGEDSSPSLTKKSPYGDLSSQRVYARNTDKALEVDASIYDYDTAYDAMKAREAEKKAAEREKYDKGESKYMNKLLAAKVVRERDYLRAKEKQVLREREKEGDEFADKEKFVTAAYKRQQEELRLQEEEEKKREELEAKKRGQHGKQVFLNKLLSEGEQKHQEDVVASTTLAKAPEMDEKKSEIEIARELNARGANIELTDDGEVADKTQLLSAGLNVMAAPKARPTKPHAVASSPQNLEASSSGTAPARERQSRMVEAQLEQLVKRQADEDADEERRKEHLAKSRKTDEQIVSARERYLQRKKAMAMSGTD